MLYDSLRGRQLAPETCAAALDVSVSQIYRWISDGKIMAVKLWHRCTRIDGDSVAEFLTSRQAVPRTPRGSAAKRSASELVAQA